MREELRVFAQQVHVLVDFDELHRLRVDEAIELAVPLSVLPRRLGDVGGGILEAEEERRDGNK